MSHSGITNGAEQWRTLTHRTRDEHVLVRDVRPRLQADTLAPGDVCIVDLDLTPRGRLAASPSAKRLSLVALEAFRQAGLAAAHVCGGAGEDVVMLANSMGLTWIGDVPHNLTAATCTIRMREVGLRSGALHRLTFDAEISADGAPVARGNGDLTCIPRAVYARMRRGASPTVPVTTRPRLFSNLEVGDTSLTARTHWDTSDALVFEHALDHVPGMHLALAALGAHELLGGVDRGLDLTFTSMAELTRPILVKASHAADGSTVVEFSDGTQSLGSATCQGRSSGRLPALANAA